MTFNTPIMTIVKESNPVPDPDSLVGSAEANELANRRPGSIIDWHTTDDGYHGDGYAIRLLEPSKWEVSLEGAHLDFHHSLKRAFAAVEHHRRESLRRHSLVIWAGLLLLAVVAGLVLVELGPGHPELYPLLVAVVFGGVSSLVRLFAVLSGNVFDPYQRRLPWEPRRWWRRLFRR